MQRHPQGGFTLLEIMVVVAIVALATASVTLALRDDPPGPRGAALLAARSLLTHSLPKQRVSPARTQATNAK